MAENKINKETLAGFAKLIHPDLQVICGDPRCGRVYCFGRVIDGCVFRLSEYMSAKELAAWFNGFYHRSAYEKALSYITNPEPAPSNKCENN